MKKIIALLLTLLLIASAIPALAAEGEEAPNLIQNSGFEELDEFGEPTGNWHATDGWDGGHAFIDNDTVFEGKNSVKIVNDDSTKYISWRAYITEGFVEGALYTLTAQVNNNFDAGGSGLTLFAEFYSGDKPDDAATYIAGSRGDTANGNTNNQFNLLSATITVPTGTKLIVVYCWVRSSGYAYVDDVQLRLSGEPDPYYFFTDNTFYYPEDKNGLAYVSIDEYYKPGDEPFTATVDYRVKDGDKVLAHAENVPFKDNGRSEYQYDLSLFTEKEHMYNVEFDLKNAAGEITATHVNEAYVYDRPTVLGTDNLLRYDGENVFHPVVAYWPLRDYPKMQEIGINVAETSFGNAAALIEKLDAMQAIGMKALVCMWSGPAWMCPPADPKNIEWARDILEAVADHPAIFAWCLQDEPLGGRGYDENQIKLLIESYKMIREYDKKYPIYILDYTPKYYHESQKYCDMFTADIYTMGNTVAVSNSGKKAVDATLGRKPAYFIGMSYKASQAGLPTVADIRGCAYRAFEVGMKSIGWYTLAKAIGQVAGDPVVDLPDTELWKPMMEMNQKEWPELFKYYCEQAYPTFNHLDDGNMQSLYYTSWVNGNDVWMVVHNRGIEDLTARVPLISANGLVRLGNCALEVVAGPETTIGIEGNEVVAEVKKQDVYLLKLTPSQTVDYSRLSQETNYNAEKTDGAFSDIGNYDWAKNEIEELYKLGIINDKNVYAYLPAENITRGDFAMYLVNTLSLSADITDNFADVTPEAPYANAVAVGKALSIFQGTGDNRFAPDAPISRQDLMTLCARAMRLAKKLANTEASADVLANYPDNGQVADYAKEAVAAMLTAAIIRGNADGTLNPLGNTTRAEAAVIMHRILYTDVIKEEVPSDEGDINEPEAVVFPPETLTDDQIAMRKKAVDMLVALGVMEPTDGESAVTRADAAKLMMRCYGYSGEATAVDTAFSDVKADTPNSGYIQSAAELKFMNGYEDGTFRPNAPVTYPQLVKMLVGLLGYNVHAESMGGYPSGYLAKAAQIGLLKGISLSGDAPVKTAIAALLLRNALDIDIAQRTAFGAGAEETYETTEDVTLLSAYMGISTYKGRITATDKFAMAGSRITDSGKVAMEQIEFVAGESGAADYMAQTVTVYAKNDEPNPTILYVDGTKNAKTVVIDADDMVLEKTTKRMLCYDNEKTEERLPIAADAVCIYNGKEKADWTAATLVPDMGTVTAVTGKTGDVETLLVDAYTNHIVKDVIPSENKINFKDGTSLRLDTGDKTVALTFTSTKGKNLAIKDCKSDNVVSVFASEDGKIMRVIVSTAIVTAAPTETDNQTCVLADTVYRLAYGVSGELPQVGKKAAFSLDCCGKIAAIDASKVGTTYGYYTAIQKEKGLNADVTLRIFTIDGNMEYYKVADNVEFFNAASPSAEYVSMTKEQLASGSNALFTLAGAAKPQLIVYELDGNGKVSSIETAMDGTSKTQSERDQKFSYDYVTTTGEGESRWVAYQQKSFADLYRYNSRTRVFKVPDTYMEEKYYTVEDPNTYWDVGRLYNSKCYDIDENYEIAVIVSTQVSTTTAPKWGSTYAVVKDIRETMLEDGTLSKAVRCITSSAEEVSVPFESGKEILLGSDAITGAGETETNGIKVNATMLAENLNPGDVILYETNPNTGMMTSAQVMFRAKSPKVVELSEEGVSKYYNFSQCTRAYGEVKRKLPEGMLIQATYERIYLFEGNGKIMPVVLYDSKNQEMKLIDPADVVAGDHVFVVKVSVYQQLTVVYR